MILRSLAIALSFAALSLPLAAQQSTLAAAPPMGWNSWDSYGLTITEAQFAANVDVLADRLKPFGWRYAVIDEGWYLKNPEQASGKAEEFQYTLNEHGQYAPALNRFPSAANGVGLRAIGDSVHAKGLLFGLHIIRGIPKPTVAANTPIAAGFHAADAADQADTCPWNPDNFGVKENAAGQAWYDGLIQQYASWGVDYLKVDCIASHPYKAGEIAMIHNAIARTGRPIVLSLSPGPTALGNAAAVGEKAQLWRISEDVWDYWTKDVPGAFPQSLKNQFAVIASWQPYVKPGDWPDADMLPLGVLAPAPGWEKSRSSRLTQEEQRTMVTLWSIARSPLFMGGNLTQLDAFTASLLTNAEVLAMNQKGYDQRLAAQAGDIVVWTSRGDGGVRYVAIFNLGDSAAKMKAPLSTFGLERPSYQERDLWTKKDLGKLAEVAGEIPAHGCLLLALHP